MKRAAVVAMTCVVVLSSCGRANPRAASVDAFNHAKGAERINFESFTPIELLRHSTVALHGRVASVQDGRISDIGGPLNHSVTIGIEPDDVVKEDPDRKCELVYFELGRRDDSTIEEISEALPKGTELALFGGPGDDAGFPVEDPDAGREPGASVYFPLPQGLWFETEVGFESVLTDLDATSGGAWSDVDSWSSLKQAAQGPQ